MRSASQGARVVRLLLTVLPWTLGCPSSGAAPDEPGSRAATSRSSDRDPAPARDPAPEPDVASVVDRVYAPTPGPEPLSAPPPRVLPAVIPDTAWAAGPPVPARRLVYRIELEVPIGLGAPPRSVPPPLAELRVDVADERLRARFEGTGWPVPPGSEVRLRRDRPGVYLFDGRGGRPLLPSELAEWFQGGPRRGFHPFVQLHRAGEQPLDGPGELVCAFLAELSAQPREPLVRRCGQHGAPSRFRVGPWIALRTADVPLDLPRALLRADSVGAVDPIPELRSARLLPASALAGLQGRGFQPEGDTLKVRNRGSSRVIATVDGAAIAWVDAGEEMVVSGVDPGVHLIGGIRPLGNLALPARELRVPTTLTLRR